MSDQTPEDLAVGVLNIWRFPTAQPSLAEVKHCIAQAIRAGQAQERQRVAELEAVRLAGHFAGKTFSDPDEASAYLASLISGAVEEAIEIARAKPLMRIKELEEENAKLRQQLSYAEAVLNQEQEVNRVVRESVTAAIKRMDALKAEFSAQKERWEAAEAILLQIQGLDWTGDDGVRQAHIGETVLAAIDAALNPEVKP
jgi:SMC interacting uncharacterized protein involved in chromosome segregation